MLAFVNISYLYKYLTVFLCIWGHGKRNGFLASSHSQLFGRPHKKQRHKKNANFVFTLRF